MDYRIISIGALSRHELWGETQPQRAAHATTTLIRCGEKVILVDPGLPTPIIAARLKERSGLEPAAVTTVFLTNFRPAHRRGLAAFEHAEWFIAEAEREAIGTMLIEQFQREEDEEAKGLLQAEIALLRRCRNAPDKLAPQVDLFPLPGYTPGNCGLLLLEPNYTTLIAGDAVATKEHFEQGRVLPGGHDLEMARQSFSEAMEIADALIPGHDNLLLNTTRRSI